MMGGTIAMLGNPPNMENKTINQWLPMLILTSHSSHGSDCPGDRSTGETCRRFSSLGPGEGGRSQVHAGYRDEVWQLSDHVARDVSAKNRGVGRDGTSEVEHHLERLITAGGRRTST